MDKLTLVFWVVAIMILIYGIRNFRTGFGGYFSSRKSKYHHSTLVSVLLNLPEDKADELLELYKKEFGPGPARYARQTLGKWKTGRVQPASQTYRRFLVHLPKVMTFDLKCDVLRHFMQEFASKTNYEVDVSPDDWEEKISPMIEQIIDRTYTAELPVEVESKLKWLGDGDMQAVQNILRTSQVEECRIMVSKLHDDFENLEMLLTQDNLNPKVTHVLKFPYGTIELNVKRR